jgi:hypothetical protein
LLLTDLLALLVVALAAWKVVVVARALLAACRCRPFRLQRLCRLHGQAISAADDAPG